MPPSRDNVVNKFWALFLDSTLAKDGHVPGFREKRALMTPWAQHQADRFAEACRLKVERDDRDPEECIAAGVAALRDQLRHHIPAQPKPDSPAYMRFRNDLVQRIRSEALTPNQVADALEVEGLLENCHVEVGLYRSWGDVWPVDAIKQLKAAGL